MWVEPAQWPARTRPGRECRCADEEEKCPLAMSSWSPWSESRRSGSWPLRQHVWCSQDYFSLFVWECVLVMSFLSAAQIMMRPDVCRRSLRPCPALRQLSDGLGTVIRGTRCLFTRHPSFISQCKGCNSADELNNTPHKSWNTHYHICTVDRRTLRLSSAI